MDLATVAAECDTMGWPDAIALCVLFIAIAAVLITVLR